jgi:hypothetical protein
MIKRSCPATNRIVAMSKLRPNINSVVGMYIIGEFI